MIIALIEDTLKVSAFVSVENNTEIKADIIDPEVEPTVTSFIASLETKDPTLRFADVDEGQALSDFGVETIPKGDERYLHAVAEELQSQGFNAIVINNKVKDLLIFTSQYMPFDQLQQSIGAIVVLSNEEADAMVAELRKIQGSVE